MTSYCLQLKIVKCWINNISRNIKAVFLKLGTTICPSQKKQNDTLSAVAIATLSAPVSFCLKNESSICNLLSETKVPTWNRRSSHIVLTPINRLCRVNDSFLRQKLRFSVFIKTTPVLDWARAVKHGGHGTNELLESSNLVATVMVIIS